jgi:hypothetical protein
VKPEIQEAINNQAQKEQQDQPTDQMPIDLGPVRPGFKTPGKREGEHKADDKEEKGEDQILEMEALPCHVLELLVERVHQRMVNQLTQAMDHFLAEGNPQHVEAAKRVDGGDAAGNRRVGS